MAVRDTTWRLTAGAGPWTVSGYEGPEYCTVHAPCDGIGADVEPYVLSSTRNTWCVVLINYSPIIELADVTPRREAIRNVDYGSRPYSAMQIMKTPAVLYILSLSGFSSSKPPKSHGRRLYNTGDQPTAHARFVSSALTEISPLPWFLISSRLYSCYIQVQSYDLFLFPSCCIS